VRSSTNELLVHILARNASTVPLIALTREISPRLAECELTHLARSPIDVEQAREEHGAYEAALREAGAEVRRVPAAPELPDSVFVEDAAVVLDELAIICRPGAASRRAETAAVGTVLRALLPVVAILAPGTLDGGDVLRVGRRLFVGRSARTNAEGIRQLASIARSAGYEVRPVDFAGCLHLKTAASLVGDGLALANPAWVAPEALAPLTTIPVEPNEPFAANALYIGGVVIYPAEFVQTRGRLEAHGVRVRTVPAGELAKAEGGVTCCSVIVELANRFSRDAAGAGGLGSAT
jgi:dimethylargininase